MPRNKQKNQPSYRLHKQSGQAIVTLVDAVTGRRKDVLLGKHDTPQSRTKYYEVLGRWEANGRELQDSKAGPPQQIGGVTVRRALQLYKAYKQPLVSPSHGMTIARALQLAIDKYGDTSAAAFDTLKLEQVRFVMVGLGWQRDTINKGVQIIVRAFRWAASKKLVGEPVYRQLTTLDGLSAGELETADGRGVPAAPEADIDAVRPFLPRQICAMIDLQLLTGMRPGEVVLMRAVDITVAGKVWYYDPPTHKTAHLGKSRRVRLGPRCIEIIKPFMTGLRTDGYLFDPRQVNAEAKARGAEGSRRPNQMPNRPKSDRVIGEQLPHRGAAGLQGGQSAKAVASPVPEEWADPA